MRKIDKLFLALLLLAGIYAQICNAYPELVRHGQQCAVCHVSPDGGGLLTAYGRTASVDVLSTRSKDKSSEADFLHGLVSLPDWLTLGGNVRLIQTYQNTPRVERANVIWMQGDLEAAFNYKDWSIVGTVGRQESTSKNYAGGTIFSRRHYLNYHATDEISVRAGRFFPAFGINADNHAVLTRRGLNFEEGAETYNIEGAYISDLYDVFVTASFGRPEATNLRLYKGVYLRGSRVFAEKFKTGLSYSFGTNNDVGKRHLIGPYAILGVSPEFFVLIEWDLFNNRPNASDPQWGMVNYLRVNYEVYRGVNAYFTQEYMRGDFKDSNNTTEGYGVGIQFFPRPHFEINALYQKQRTLSVSNSFSDVAWVLAHYYP